MSVGGSSDDAYRVGGSLADIFGLWGEPLKETKEQIDRIYAEAEKAGRADRPRIWVTFRPIVAETEDVRVQFLALHPFHPVAVEICISHMNEEVC